MNLTDWIGSIGVFMILLAFVLNLFGKLDNKQIAFIILNFLGALLACIASIMMNYLPFIILEAVWTFASFIAMIKYFSKK